MAQLLSSYAVADAELGFDGAISASSTTLTSASAPFVAGDVGKTMIVAGAGASGADLRTTIASFTSASSVTLANAASTGVTAAGFTMGTNASPGLQSALNAIAAAGGGSLIVDGRFLLSGAASVNLLGAGVVSIIGEGRLYIAAGPGVDAIALANAERLSIQGVVFVGGAGGLTDARRVLMITGCNVVLDRNSFYNISTRGESSGAVVAALQGTGLTMSDNLFLGCSGSNAIVYADEVRAFSANRDAFIDLSNLDGRQGGKLVNNPPATWVKIGDPLFDVITSTSDSVIRFTDVKMDEGAVIGICVDPLTGRMPHVLIDGLQQNTFASPTGIGVKIRHTDWVEILRSSIGTFSLVAAIHPGVSLFDCGDVKISNLRSDQPSSRLVANKLDSLTLENSYGFTNEVLAQVGTFVLIEHGVVVTPTNPMLINDNPSYAIITTTTNEDDTAALSGSAPAVWQNVAHSYGAFNGGQAFAAEVKAVTVASGVTVGLHIDPYAAGAYNSIPTGFIKNSKWLTLWNGIPTATTVNAVNGDILRIEHHPGGNIVWKINGTQVRSETSPFTEEQIIFLDIDMSAVASGVVTLQEWDEI